MLAHRSPSHPLLKVSGPAPELSKTYAVGFVAFAPPEKNAAFNESPSSKTSAPPILPGRGELILVVDDDKAILEILQLTLQSFGYRVVTANDGVDGLRAYARHTTEIKAVITDMAMPVMDGPALIAALKRLNPSVKMIAATGMSSHTCLETITRLGVDRVISKPFNGQTLLNALQAELKTA